jgi:hypothetical protein
MSKELKEQIKSLVLNIFVNEKDYSIKTKVCDIVSQIAENVYENEEKWDDLLVIILNSLTLELNSQNLLSIEGALSLLSGVFGFVYDEMITKISDLVTVFKIYFSTNVISLKTRVIRTLAEMVSYSDEEEIEYYKDFMYNIMETTLQCLEDSKEENNVI